MKRETVKNTLLTILQVPVLIGLLLVYKVETFLIKCGVYLSNPFSPLQTTLLRFIHRIEDVHSTATQPQHDQQGLEKLIAWLAARSEIIVDAYRRHLESKIAVLRQLIEAEPHLYAVLKPTKQENLKRIENALMSLPAASLNKWLKEKVECLTCS